MKKRRFSGLRLITFIVVLTSLGVIIYNLPPVRERLEWRLVELFARFKYAISPPELAVFLPNEADLLPTQTASPQPPPVAAQSTAIPSPIPAKTATPIPSDIQLTGFRHEYQTWNNCGPATLGMLLSFWGWEGDQRPIAAFTKPNSRDKNVMPYELAAYVEDETGFEVMYRMGGEVDLLKRFLAAGIPVIIEKGFEGRDFDGWMGHYVLVTGYSDTDQRFILQDSYYGPDQEMEYSDLVSYWRAFNFTYLVIYPPERKANVETILGSNTGEEYAYQYAAQKAADEIYKLDGRNRFFAWFNRGTSLAQLKDYASAAAAYDQAFSLYPTIAEKERPWRMMWYQTGPYWAYYYTGRYQDVIDLATTTLDAMSEPVLEESYYWRALAREALGDDKGALKDLRSSLEYHPGFKPALIQLEQLKLTP